MTAKENKFLNTGKERQTDLDLNWDDYGARMYMPELGRFTTQDPLAYIFQSYSPYLYALNNPIRFEDTNGEGPGDRVKKAKSFVGTPYTQAKALNQGAELRTSNSAAALRYLDCSEFVFRVLAADQVTKGVVHGNTATLKTFLGNDEKFIKSQSPEVGDIFLWRESESGHTGVVTGVKKDADGNVTVEITHSKGTADGTVTEEYSLEHFTGHTGWQGFFRPKVETEDGKIDLTGLSGEEKIDRIISAIERLNASLARAQKRREKREQRRKEKEEKKKDEKSTN